MADGSVSFETQLDNSGIPKGVKDAEKQFDKMADAAQGAAKSIGKSFDSIDYKATFEKLPDSFKDAFAKIEAIRNDDAADNKAKAAQIAAIYRKLGADQSTAMKNAWTVTKAESEEASRKVIENLRDIASEADNASDEIGDKARETGNDVESAFSKLAGKIAGTLATVFAADQLIEFGKSAIQATADVRAENAQFEQTFKELAGTATKSLDTIAKETGITASRMKKSYTSIYAFSKSIGAESAEAMGISDRAMRVAADSAAYYDRTLEETTETLQSFLKGNYENDAALGIAATETTRNAMANQLYAKSFKDLTEAQKVDVLLAMVEAGNKASGAMGQAAREADSWTNVTGELAEAWRQFQAVIGAPLLDLATPVIKNITGALYSLIDLSSTFKIGDLFGDIDLGPITASLSSFSGKCSELAGVISTGLAWAWDNVLVPLGTWSIEAGLPAVLDALGAAFGALASALEWLAPLADAVWNNFLKPLASFVGDTIVYLLEALANAFNFLSSAFSNAAVDSVTAFKNAMGVAGSFMQTGMVDPITAGLNDIAAKSGETSAQVASDSEAALASVAADETAIVEKTQENMGQITQSYVAATDEMETALQDGLQNVENNVTDSGDNLVDAAQSSGEAWEDSANTMKDAFTGMDQWFEANVESPIKTSIENLRQTMLDTWSQMEQDTADSWAAMVQTVDESITEMQGRIDSLTGKTVYINTVQQNSSPKASAETYSGEAYSPANYSPAAFNVTPQYPVVASGGIIPTMAVSSVRRNSSAISEETEASLRKLADMVTELDSIEVQNNITFEGDLAALVRVLYPVIKSEVRRKGTSLAKEVIF